MSATSDLQANDPGLGRRERRKLELRHRILESAMSLFDERGFQNAKVSEICERADVAEKTFFNHFQSKQHLLKEIASFALDEFLSDIEQARKSQNSTRARLHALFEQIADKADEAGPMRPEFVHELIRIAHGSSDLEPEQARKLHDAFGAIVRDGLEGGDIHSDHDAATLTEMAMGAFYVVMFNWSNFEDYPFRKRALAAARFLGDAMAAKPGEEGA